MLQKLSIVSFRYADIAKRNYSLVASVLHIVELLLHESRWQVALCVCLLTLVASIDWKRAQLLVEVTERVHQAIEVLVRHSWLQKGGQRGALYLTRIRASEVQSWEEKILIAGVCSILLVLKGFARPKRHSHHVLLIPGGLGHRGWLRIGQCLGILLLEKVLVLALVVAVPYHINGIRHAQIHLVALEFHSTEEIIACVDVVDQGVIHGWEAGSEHRRWFDRLNCIHS